MPDALRIAHELILVVAGEPVMYGAGRIDAAVEDDNARCISGDLIRAMRSRYPRGPRGCSRPHGHGGLLAPASTSSAPAASAKARTMGWAASTFSAGHKRMRS